MGTVCPIFKQRQVWNMSLPKPKKISKSKIKNKAWEQFSIYIRLRDSLRTTGTTTHALCFTCDKDYPSFGKGCLQAGHFISGRHPSLLFDERGVHAQCYNCNINLKGNWVKYEDKMLKVYGLAVVLALKRLDDQFKTYTVEELQWLFEHYKEKNAKIMQGDIKELERIKLVKYV